MKTLAVISPFGDHQVGDKITEEDAIEAILDGENARYVVVSVQADKNKSVNAEED